MKMMALAIILGATLGWGELWQRLTRDTSSHAANDRGVSAFANKQYADAAKQFRRANEVAPSAAHAFNAGTAEIAAGHNEQAARILTQALRDPQLRADATYNRGNGALKANELDAAIHDYIDTLKLRPSDAQAKRNLEIALQKKQAQQQSGNGQQQQGGKQPDPKQQKQPNQPSPRPNGQQASKGDPNTESLLRAVQQQEQEELQRMRRVSPERGRVGW